MKKRLVLLITIFMMVILSLNIQAMEFGEFGTIDIHGFISQGYMITNENNFFADTEENGTVQFNEMGLIFTTDVTDKLRIGAQIFSRDLGTLSNNELTVDWAFADYRYRDWLGILVGKIKIPFGLNNEFRDVDSLRTPIFLPQSVYNEAWRVIFSSVQGAGVYGDIPMNVAGSLNYTFLYGSVNMGPDSGTARTFEDQLTGLKVTYDVFGTEYTLGFLPLAVDVTEFDMDYYCLGNLQWSTPLDGLKLCVSVWDSEFAGEYVYTHDNGELPAVLTDGDTSNDYDYILNDPTKTLNPSILNYFQPGYAPEKGDTDKAKAEAFSYILSVEYMIGNLVLSAEYARVTYNLEFAGQEIPEFDSVGYYGSAAYQIFDWFELGTYYSEYYNNDDDRDGKDRVESMRYPEGQEHRAWLKDFCLTTRFDITDNWIFKLEGHKMDGAAILIGKDNPPEGDETRSMYEKDWYLFAAKVSYRF